MSSELVLLITTSILFNATGDVETVPRTPPVVDTNVGRIQGLRATDGDYDMFLGIPFGVIDPANPFGPSTPHPNFNETYVANDDTARCFQGTGGQLDCLRLNIFVPSGASPTKKLPVFVWIYGGAFQGGAFGRTQFGPKFLVKHDIIFVTLNYRVNVYGFMCLDIPEVPGNQGLKDQLLALRWIRDNIEAFGGDVNQMTLAGVSAGGKSVDFHLHLSKEIPFKGYILQSGTVLLPHLEKEPDPTAPVQMAQFLGYNTTDVREALKFLAETDFRTVLTASRQLGRFEPCYEKKFDNVESFLTERSINLDASNVEGKNIIVGFAEDEWLSRHYRMTEQGYQNWRGFRGELSQYFDFDEKELTKMVNLMRRFYIGDGNIGPEYRFQLSAFDSDFLFNYPAERSIDKYLENNAGNIYYYVFTYVGGRNTARIASNLSAGGATHGDEQGYLFDMTRFHNSPITPQDQLMIDRMTTLWTNFVKYGNPTPAVTELLPVKWESVKSINSSRYYMDLDSELSLKRAPFNDRMSFWKLFYKSNKEKQRGYKPTED